MTQRKIEFDNSMRYVSEGGSESYADSVIFKGSPKWKQRSKRSLNQKNENFMKTVTVKEFKVFE